ncbi:hypothetical protein [Actinomadura madurae]|uniref:hypothetical protein n=1 Tax=Actinomadura madurae TaxID=1993 RepID=UPI0020D22F8A|nr:hypothetical protein [Actinomadura madurae]MCQ0014091.1 hypothetical protein [Actinomadura madurae]
MTVIPGLVRRAAAEAERHLREGAGLLVRAGRDLERSARLARLLPDYIERVAVLEREVRDQGTEVRAIRIELDSLVGQLNDRLLPRIDERMDDTERDLAAVATSLIRTGRETAGPRRPAGVGRAADRRAAHQARPAGAAHRPVARPAVHRGQVRRRPRRDARPDGAARRRAAAAPRPRPPPCRTSPTARPDRGPPRQGGNRASWTMDA